MVTNFFKSLLDFDPFASLSGLFSGSLGARTGEGVFLKKRKEEKKKNKLNNEQAWKLTGENHITRSPLLKKAYGETIQMKATEQYFPVVLFLSLWIKSVNLIIQMQAFQWC